MDLDLASSLVRQLANGKQETGHLETLPVPVHVPRPRLLEPPDRPADVVDLLGSWTGGTCLDPRVPPAAPADIAFDDLASPARFEDAHDAVGVAGDMGQHVTHRPIWQSARSRRVEAALGERLVEHGQKPLVGGGRAGNVTVERPRCVTAGLVHSHEGHGTQARANV